MPVLALECFSAFETGIFFRGFGLRRLVSQSFFGAKAPLDPVSRFFYNALSSRLSRQAHGGILLVSALLEICILNRENFCVTEFLLLLPPSQDVSTH